MSIPEKILQAGCDAYTATFLIGNGSLGDGIEAAYLAIHGHDDWVRVGLPAWTGEGLPPVGTVCEHHKLIHGEEWTRVEIVAHRTFDGDDYPCAVFVYSQSSSHSSSGDHFRPCRTPEQIAADEREAGVEGIRQAVSKSPNCKAHGVNWDIACAIYDAGYRKQVES